jgi:DNA-3-methyladenine glycosylase I
MTRCFWCNLKNPLYVKYHDEEWGKIRLDDKYLFEMLLLESFQAGLSWECVLNKREAFKIAFDGFDVNLISQYGEEKIELLCQNSAIIRNRRKICATVKNAQAFISIVSEFGSFLNYLRTFWDGKIICDFVNTKSDLSDMISKDLKKRGMSFVGSTVVYSFLQAVGIINSHTTECFLYGMGC